MREPGLLDPDIRSLLERMVMEAPLGPVGVGRAVRTARRRIALTWVGMLVAFAVAAGGTAAMMDSARDHGGPQPADRPSFTSSDLPSVVLSSPDDVVGVLGSFGVAGRLTSWGPQAASVVTVEEATEVSRALLDEAGMLDGYLGWYSTHAFDENTGGTSLVSIAMLFPDEAAAGRGVEVFRRESPQIWRISRFTPAPSLGDGGFLIDGRYQIQPTITFVWQHDNLVLFLGSEGHVGVADFRRLAEEMDLRAAARAA